MGRQLALSFDSSVLYYRALLIRLQPKLKRATQPILLGMS